MRNISILFLIAISIIFNSCHKEEQLPDLNYEYPNYIDLKSFSAWSICSIPLKFPESNLGNDLRSGFNRAKIAWYKIDPLFLRNNSLTPAYIMSDADQQSNHLVREVFETEIFPEREGIIPLSIRVLNLAYYPEEKGTYNFETYSTEYSAGINSEGKLNNPQSRWAGIQHEIPNTGKLVDTLDFWLMDPFVYNKNIEGELYIDLGDISEDVLKNSKLNTEEGFYNIQWDTTAWGKVPHIANSGESSGGVKDYGLDGLKDFEEQSFFNEYLNEVSKICKNEIYTQIKKDPSNDNYHSYIGEEYDELELSILNRYKRYNDLSGNSTGNSWELYSKIPDSEDINSNNYLETENKYVEYKISIRNSDFIEGQNFIVEKRFGNDVDLPNGEQDAEITWYHFKIPLSQYEDSYGIGTFNGTASSIRIYLTNFNDEVILRFATLDLIENVN